MIHSGGGSGTSLIVNGYSFASTRSGRARTTAHSLQPDVAIVVDVTHATDAPGIDVARDRVLVGQWDERLSRGAQPARW